MLIGVTSFFRDAKSVEPGQVFAAVHDLFTCYVDFRSPIESPILTLLMVGTYFYTMFPVHPYLASNGPKNSDRSTVMRVMQPPAINMVAELIAYCFQPKKPLLGLDKNLVLADP